MEDKGTVCILCPAFSVDEDVSILCLRATIYRLQCRGLIEHRRDPRMRKNGFQLKKATP
jgi:hypothetical protein